MRKPPPPRPPQPGSRRRRIFDPELAREIQAVRLMQSGAAQPIGDGEFYHADQHGDRSHRHQDTPKSHHDYVFPKHDDWTHHLDSDRPRPDFGDQSKPPNHEDVNAGHLDVTWHHDNQKGDHIDYVEHVDRGAWHEDEHYDYNQGHLDSKRPPPHVDV